MAQTSTTALMFLNISACTVITIILGITRNVIHQFSIPASPAANVGGTCMLLLIINCVFIKCNHRSLVSDGEFAAFTPMLYK